MEPSQDFAKLLGLYEAELLDDVMPWWMDHAIDREDGGILPRPAHGAPSYTDTYS